RTRAVPLGASLALAIALIVFQKPLSARTMESLLYKATAKDNPPLARLVENRDGIIAVSPSGIVYGGGAYDGRFNIDLVHDTNGILRPYGLSFYSPNPRDVLMIGLSSGSWGQVIANNPYVDHLTIIEINPGYTQLIRERREVSSLLVNPKVQIVIDDGRRWLKQHPGLRFDAIIANTSINYRSNAANVLSMEFDRLAQAHLKPDGVYFFNATDSKRVERTGCKSFKYGYRVFNHMLVSDVPFDLNVDRWRKTLLAYTIDGNPALHMDRPTDVAVLRRALNMATGANSNSLGADKRQMESCSSILSRTRDLQVITDDNMGTEWRYIFGLE
ncbi:MAG TPA: hypothetical protein VKB94_05105, partial [Rhizomicrobium sp.]|nr:hypothetical protein [Rhizomicrobium sp.]